ncbi:replication initiation protein [Paraclostridium bifermentans]|uniref:replication initiation protein n=1 Tax=Paraclostridium bifermentans TaxID=1490 RepID=UPI0025B1420A|nr:replication initiation protein [Paraclostridium bifermentans]
MDKNEILMKNNVLIKARYDINTYENKLFILLLYKLQRINETTCKCVLKVDEIKDILKARSVRNKKEIAKLLTDLRKRSIYFKINNEWGNYGFINGFTYKPDINSFEIEASEKVYSLLREYLDNGYTPINMRIWLTLKSSYAQRFYDLLRLWSNTKTVIEYTLEELRELLILEDKYTEYRDFKRRVINPAIKELNETNFFDIKINEKKIGRKVNSIEFIVKDLDKRKYFDKNDIKEVVECEENGNNKDLETVKEEKCINTIFKQTETLKIENKEFYVPDKTVFTKGTLRSFKMDFANIDFKDTYMKRAFDGAVMITLDRDDVETIKATSYKFFKGTLDNKILEYGKEKETDIKHKQEMDMFW